MTTKTTVNGCPGFEGRTEYQRLMAECAAAHSVQQSPRKPSKFKLAWFEWNPRLVAMLIALLVVLSTLLWVGCRAKNAAPSAVENHTTAIIRALTE